MEIYDSRYFIINKTLMTKMGLWPYQHPLKKFLLYGLKKNFGVHMDKIIEHLALLMYIYGIKLKLVTSILSEKKLKKVYENIMENWQQIKDVHERAILVEYSERGRTLTIGYIMYMTSALLFFIILPITPMVLNVIKPLNESRPWDFIMHGEFPVNDMHAHYGEIYLFDSLACIATVLVFCTVDSMYATCIEHCIGLFAIVKSRLDLSTKFVNRQGALGIKRDDKVYDLIVKTIKLHKKIINFTHILESSYSTSFLILMGMNMLYCSLVSVLLIIKSDALMERIRYGTILLGLLIHLFYISWPGQKIIDLSTGLFEDAYSNEWYETSIRSQNLLKFMRLRCLTPCQLTAGGIYVMNFANFASIIKTSTSYITVFASFT
ncbi:odorant receptor 140 isoform X1 [Nasonia vitripennis]|uniref:Odorant receptor n=1 Tax=Nasonia vitripennis TaxID=7425 RepID=A0A7M7H124_NASVI|nr:odorant receptor 140 isoform X1 [Nasonia vitripennis]